MDGDITSEEDGEGREDMDEDAEEVGEMDRGGGGEAPP